VLIVFLLSFRAEGQQRLCRCAKLTWLKRVALVPHSSKWILPAQLRRDFIGFGRLLASRIQFIDLLCKIYVTSS
jgi:hypothetical protein